MGEKWPFGGKPEVKREGRWRSGERKWREKVPGERKWGKMAGKCEFSSCGGKMSPQKTPGTSWRPFWAHFCLFWAHFCPRFKEHVLQHPPRDILSPEELLWVRSKLSAEPPKAPEPPEPPKAPEPPPEEPPQPGGGAQVPASPFWGILGAFWGQNHTIPIGSHGEIHTCTQKRSLVFRCLNVQVSPQNEQFYEDKSQRNSFGVPQCPHIRTQGVLGCFSLQNPVF